MKEKLQQQWKKGRKKKRGEKEGRGGKKGEFFFEISTKGGLVKKKKQNPHLNV
jgi:hypothetical protein